VRTSASEEAPLPPCPKDVRTGQYPLTANVFYGRKVEFAQTSLTSTAKFSVTCIFVHME